MTTTLALDDERHGSNRGYMAGCHKTCCRDAHAAYKRDRRTRVYLARGPLLVDARGTRRRLQALVALGYSFNMIALELGHGGPDWVYRVLQRSRVRRTTAQEITQLYRRWSMTMPTPTGYTRRTRRLAARKGWAPPLAWDDIDNPREQPKGVSLQGV